MLRATTIFIIFLFHVSMSGLKAQTTRELGELKNKTFIEEPAYKRITTNSTNELKILLHTSFIFYKRFISSQDGNHCSFSPSCSEYAALSIQSKGVVKGILNALDRLQRCNGMSGKRYEVDKKTGLLIDPVD